MQAMQRVVVREQALLVPLVSLARTTWADPMRGRLRSRWECACVTERSESGQTLEMRDIGKS